MAIPEKKKPSAKELQERKDSEKRLGKGLRYATPGGSANFRNRDMDRSDVARIKPATEQTSEGRKAVNKALRPSKDSNNSFDSYKGRSGPGLDGSGKSPAQSRTPIKNTPKKAPAPARVTTPLSSRDRTTGRNSTPARVSGVAVARGGFTDNLPSSDRRPATKPDPKATPITPTKGKKPTGKAPVGGGRVAQRGVQAAAKAPTVAGGSAAPRGTAAPAKASGKPAPKSAAQLATEKKMRDQATSAARAKSAREKLDSYTKDAEASVDAELLPAINDLKRQISEIEARGTKGKNELDARGKRGAANLEELYGRLNNFLGQTGDIYNQKAKGFRESTGARYDRLQGEFDAIQTGAVTNTNKELERLGLGEVSQAANADTLADTEFARKMAAVDRESALGTQDAMTQGFNQILGLQRNNAVAEGADQVGRFTEDNEKRIADLMFEIQQGTTNLRGKQGDIEATRGQKTQELIRALMDRDYEREQERQQIAFQQNLATKEFGITEAQARANMQPQAASYDDILNTALLEQRLADARFNAPSNPLGPNAPAPTGPIVTKTPVGVDPRRRSDRTPIGGL